MTILIGAMACEMTWFYTIYGRQIQCSCLDLECGYSVRPIKFYLRRIFLPDVSIHIASSYMKLPTYTDGHHLYLSILIRMPSL
jgi:hypothetical protein